MRYIVQTVEQLDRAATELQEGFPVNNRVSLILTDNAVELVLHKRCDSIFKRERQFLQERSIGRYSRLARHRVLGQHFDQKLKFLKAEGDINENEYNFIRICHDLRNEAYHQGLTRDDILFPVAWEYHSLACDLFARWEPSFRSSYSEPPLTDRFKQHLEPELANKSLSLLAISTRDLATSLHRARPPLTRPLNATLADSLIAKIEEVQEQMEFLVRDDPTSRPQGELLRDVQFYADLFDEIPLEIEEGTGVYRQHILEKSKAMEATWQPKHATFPVENWRGRAERIREPDRYSAVQRYEQLSKEMEYLATAIDEAAYALDSHIQAQVDHYLTEQAFAKNKSESNDA